MSHVWDILEAVAALAALLGVAAYFVLLVYYFVFEAKMRIRNQERTLAEIVRRKSP